MPSICLLDQTAEFSGQPAPTTTTPPPLSAHLSWCLLPIGPLQRLMLYTFTPRGPGETHGPKKEEKKRSGREKKSSPGRAGTPAYNLCWTALIGGPLSPDCPRPSLSNLPSHTEMYSWIHCFLYCIFTRVYWKEKKKSKILSLCLYFFFLYLYFF